VSAVALDIDTVRKRFSALSAPTVFFDGPGGTQVPDSVIDAIARYLRESNANLDGAFDSSRRSDALLTQARLTAAAFLRCDPGETIFGANMTTLNFALTRAFGRTLREGDELLGTTHVDGQGLLADHIPAGPQRATRERDVQVVRRTDVHDAHAGILERARIFHHTPRAERTGECDAQLAERLGMLGAGIAGADDECAAVPFHGVIVSAAPESRRGRVHPLPRISL